MLGVTDIAERPTLRNRLRSLIESGTTPDEAVAKVLGSYRTLKDFREDVHGLVSWQAQTIARGLTREIEQQVRSGQRGAAGGEVVEIDFDVLDGQWFWVPEVGQVSWLDAEEEHHLARSEWQRRLASACIADAELHECAARMIRDAGVKRLRDLLEKAA